MSNGLPATRVVNIYHTTNISRYRSRRGANELRERIRYQKGGIPTEVQGLVSAFDVLLGDKEKVARLNTRSTLMEQIKANNVLSTPPQSRQEARRTGSSLPLKSFISVI